MPIARSLLSLALILCVLSPAFTAGHATAPPINVVVTQDKVNLSLSLQLKENLTSLPLFTSTLDSSNSSVLATPMQAAMQKLVPGARIDSLSLRAGTSLVDPVTKTWRFVENYTLVVEGVNQNLGGLVKSNLAFLAMNISDPISLGGIEINGLGRQYLLAPFENLPFTATSAWFFDGAPYLNSNVSGNNTETFNLLDFSWVAPVSQWSTQSDPLAGSTVWSLTPRLSPFNLTTGLRQIENILFPLYEAVYYPTLQISAPARSWAEGTTVMFNLSTPAEPLMAIIIAASLAILVVTTVFDRRLTSRVVKKRPQSGPKGKS